MDDVQFEFTAENQQEISNILKKYPPQYKKAAVIPLLHMAQKQNSGWTSLPVMNKIADILEMPPMRVYEVATFYTMFNRTPIGKHHVQVPRSLFLFRVLGLHHDAVHVEGRVWGVGRAGEALGGKVWGDDE